MKLKIGVFTIIIATAAIIGIMNLSLSTASSIELPKTTKSQEPVETKKPASKKEQKVKTGHRQEISEDEHPLEEQIASLEAREVGEHEEIPAASDTNGLSREDIQKINSIVNLSENDLERELNKLKTRIEEEDLFGKLEEGLLTKEKEAEAKEALEQFALLGLEKTRRKYMAIDPELKDPIFAFKDSLKEIRELLNDDFDNDDDDLE